MRLRGLALKLLVGALPVCEVAAVGLAFLDPDAIGAFADPVLVGPAGALDRRRRRDAAGAFFLLVVPLLVGVLAMRSPLLEFSLAAPVPEGSASAR